MSIFTINDQLAGEVGVIPNIVRIGCNDDFSTITTPGFLSPVIRQGYQISVGDLVLINYGANSTLVNSFVAYISGGLITLQLDSLQNFIPGTNITFTTDPDTGETTISSGTVGVTPPSEGGTGVSNPTAHTVPIAEGAANFNFLGPLTNGQLLIGSTGNDPVIASISNGTNISWTPGAGTLQANFSGTLSLPQGGTGITSATAYAVLCGGTTSTGGFQSVASVGATGQVLTSNGAAALPTFQNVSGTGTVNSGTINQMAWYAATGNTISGLATAANGLLVTSNSNVPSILSGPGTSGNILQSNVSSSPSFSTATYPSVATSSGTILMANGTNWIASTSTFSSTYSASNLLYSNGANTVTGLATANNSVLVTNGTGIPSLSTTLPSGISATNMALTTPSLGTPSAGTLTNCTGFPAASLSGLGTGVGTALGQSVTGSGGIVLANSPSLVTPALGIPASGTLTNCTGFPAASLSGLGTGVGTALGQSVTGSGGIVLGTSPSLVTPALGTPSSGTLTNCTGLPIGSGVSGLGTGVATSLGSAVSGSGGLVAQTTPTINQLNWVGTTTNNNAAAGSVGEFMQTTVGSGSAVALTTNVTANICSISLTAGDWDVQGNAFSKTGTGTTTSAFNFGISSTSATLQADYTGALILSVNIPSSANYIAGFNTGNSIIKLASTTTIYLVANCTFAVSTLSAYGWISARRVR